MNNILAVDKGTTYTKTSNLTSIKSTIREYRKDELNFSQDKVIVEHHNKKYVIGEDGRTNTDLFKSEQDETKLLILTAIALSNPNQTYQHINLITGLPIGRVGYERDAMKRLFQFTSNKLKVNDVDYTINIGETEVFPEGASSFYHLQDVDECLIIDIGGLSIDTALYSKGKKLTKYSTYRLGIMPLYREIANHIGSKYSLSLSEWLVHDIITDGLSIDGINVELDISSIIGEYLQQILQALEFDYSIPSIKNIFLTGGGGIFLYPYIKKHISRIQLMDNARFTNVLTYQILGEVLFK